MVTRKTNTGLTLLFGLEFLSPITYSIMAYEMDVVQRMVYFSLSILLFFAFILKLNLDREVYLNKLLTLLIIFFPLCFLTAFLNDSASLLTLKYSDLLIPFVIILQSTIVFLVLGEDRFFKVVSYSVVIFSTLFSIVGMLEVFQVKLIELPTVMPPGSMLGHRGFASEYLLSALPFFLIAHQYVERKNRKFLLIAAVFCVSFLLFTRSRAGVLILLVITISYFIYTFFKTDKKKFFNKIKPVLIVLAASLLFSFIPSKVGERPDLKSTAETFFDTEFKSNKLRLNFWDASFKMIQEKPLVGFGLYKWSGYYPGYNGEYFDDKTLLLVHNVHAHNDFLEIFAESGVIAVVIFFLIYFFLLIQLYQKSKHNEKYFALMLTVLTAFLFSFVSFPNYKFASIFHIGVVSGVALVSSGEKIKNIFCFKFAHLKLLLFITLIFGIVISFIKIKSEIRYGEAIFLKDRRQYLLMNQKLDQVSEIFYPFDTSRQPLDYYRGIANSYLGRHSDALRNNLHGLTLAPFNPILMNNAAASYQELGKSKESIKMFETIKKNFPNYLGAQFRLLEIYLSEGQTEQAEKLYNELRKKSPGNPSLERFKNHFQ